MLGGRPKQTKKQCGEFAFLSIFGKSLDIMETSTPQILKMYEN